MHVANDKQVALEFVIFFTFEKSWGDEKKF